MQRLIEGNPIVVASAARAVRPAMCADISAANSKKGQKRKTSEVFEGSCNGIIGRKVRFKVTESAREPWIVGEIRNHSFGDIFQVLYKKDDGPVKWVKPV